MSPLPAIQLFAAVILALAGCGQVSSANEDAAAAIDSSSPDAAAICPKTPCDLVAQCGCAEPQVCDLDLGGLPAGDTECRDVTAMGRELDRCTRLEECAGGYLCGAGQCLRYCGDDDDCASMPGSICIRQVGNGEGGTIPGVRTCSKPCRPDGLNNNNDCPVDFACRIFANSSEPDAPNRSDCVPGGPGANDAVCDSSNDCRPGFNCITFPANEGGGSRCRQLCPIGAGNSCAINGQQCRALGTPPELNGVEYGFCGVPPPP